MRRLLRCACVGILAAAFAVPAAAAGSSTPVSGVVVPTSTTLTVTTAGGNTLIDGHGTHAWTGSMTGTSTIAVHLVIHSSLVVTAQGFLTFTGTTPCGSGTIHFVTSLSGPFPGPITGRSETIDEADSSVPMHAEFDVVLFLTPAGAIGTYTGDVRCG